MEGIRESSVAVFLNDNSNEYLLAYHYEGNMKNSFSVFEVGYAETLQIKGNINVIDDKTFRTESGIELGLSLNDLIKLKGDNYQLLRDKDSTIVHRINSNDNSEFLSHYNMPGYFIECSIKNQKINRFKFGFDYP